MDLIQAYDETFNHLPRHRREVFRDLIVTRMTDTEDRFRSRIRITLKIYVDFPKKVYQAQHDVDTEQYFHMPRRGVMEYLIQTLCRMAEREIDRDPDQER